MHVAACVRAGEPSYLEAVRLDFVQALPTGVQLRLTNHSAQMIKFRGTSNQAKVADPWDVHVECKAVDSAFWEEAPFALVDGEARNVEVFPGETILLSVRNKFLSKFSGGKCHISVRLQGGAFVKSNEFQP
jgi:hypothetical protein